MKLLLPPLSKIANILEDQNEFIEEIHSVLTLDLKKVSNQNNKEFKKQTVLLTEIRDLIKEQVDDKKRTINFGSRTARDIGVAGLMMVTMSLALAGAIALFSVLPTISVGQMLTIIAIAGVFLILTPIFIAIDEAFGQSAGRLVLGKLIGKEFTFKNQMQLIGGTGLLMLTMALTIGAAAAVFSVIPLVTPLQILTALGVAIALMPVTMAAAFIIVAMRKGGIKLNASGLATIALLPIIIPAILLGYVISAKMFGLFPAQLAPPPNLGWVLATSIVVAATAWAFGKIARAVRKSSATDLFKALLVLPALALSILVMANIFSKMPKQEKYKNSAPPIGWSLQTAGAILIMTIPFAFITTIASLSRFTLKELGKILLTMAAISISLVAMGMIFSQFDGNYGTPPPMKWSLNAAVALTIFAIPFLIVGKISQLLKPAGMLYGAAGMILLAGTMFVTAWIFSAMPDLSSISKNFTDAIMYPMNAIIDALARFKNEIGVDNMLPLAGGLFAIAGGWLALTAAMAGQAAGGLFSSVANLGSTIVDGLSSLFGGDAAKTPFDLLNLLTEKKADIIALASPFKTLGTVFAAIAGNTPGVIRGMSAILPFTQKNKVKILERSATAISKISDSYTKIAAASNAINVDAINASSKMFEAIANMAESDGEDAMKVLAKELMKAVESLSEVVGNLEDTVDSQNSGFENVLEGALDKFKEKIMGSATGDESDTESAFDMSTVVAAIQELESRFDRPITVEDAGTI